MVPEAHDDRVVELQPRVDDDEVHPPGEPLPNAQLFARAEFGHRERSLLVHQGGVFFAWDGTCWLKLEDAALRARLYSWFGSKIYFVDTKSGRELRPFAPDRYKIADLLDALRAIAHTPVTIVTPSWLDRRSRVNVVPPADELVACPNGLVHWRTRTLHPHTPAFFVHHSIGFDFDPDASQPQRWLAFLRDLWGDDDESIATLQELFGYLVSGDTRQQKIFLLVGPKRSGKGTIARIAKAMLGAHNIAAPTLAGLGTNFGLWPLIGKPVAIVADARFKASDTSIVTERLLAISGEDTITVDRKNLEPWTGQFSSRLVILSNELPRLSDSSGALASRFIVLVMTKSFYGRENPELTKELSAELPGIFNWALDGLERLRARGRFVQPGASTDAIRELEDLGSTIGAFIRDRCNTTARDANVSVELLYGAYRRWCADHGLHATNTQMFGRDLRANLPAIRTSQLGPERKRHYVGIALREDSRDSRMSGHCDAEGGDGATPPGAQSDDARESREPQFSVEVF